jgi:hypothetical protein
MRDKFSATFMDKIYPQWKKKILFETEKALLPQSMIYVEDVKRIPQDEEEVKEIRAVIKELEVKKAEVEERLYRARRIREGNIPDQRVKEEEEVIKRIAVPCPRSDCRGFLNHFYKCGLCETQCCKDCREIKIGDDDHKCDPNTLESVRALEKECRNCPNCAIPIFKVEGCDQMWCIKCHTAFSWKTGKVETGVVHNPHYYQYMRERAKENGGEMPRVVGGNNCGDPQQTFYAMIGTFQKRLFNARVGYDKELMVRAEKLMNKVRNTRNAESHRYKDDENFYYFMQMITGFSVHVNYTYIQGLPTPHDNRSNLDLRIKFLMNEIDEDSFKSALLRRKVTIQKQLEYRQVLETYSQLCTEYSFQFLNQMAEMKDFSQFNERFSMYLGEMERILDFTNEAIDRINKLHKGRKVANIGKKFADE